MHYEKKEIRKNLSNSYLDRTLLALLAAAMIIFTLYIHAPIEFWWPIKFVDLVNVIAQTATAAAFFLAIYQYRKNSESERQKVLIEESRALIEKMKKIADDYSQLLNSTSSVSSLDASTFMQKMSAQEGNFNAIFLEIKEGIQKAIIRMHWQDLYFINLNSAIQNLNTKLDFTDYGVSNKSYLNALTRFSISTLQAIQTPTPIYERYLQLQYLAKSSTVMDELKASNEIRTSLFVFEKLFLENDALRDHLYGSMNIIDVRVRAPLIAVLNEHFMGSEMKRDSLAFKAFWPH